MSLSSLNAPPLVATLSLSCFPVFRSLQDIFQRQAVSWAVVKGANLCAYGLSLWSVSRPGRYDGEVDGYDGKINEGKPPSEMAKMSPGKQGRTLLPPAGWAFAIWGPIFLGELVMVGAQLTLEESSEIAPIIRKVTGPYVAAQIFQTLWTTSFRPKYNQGVYKYVSAVNLSGIAYALSFCHEAYSMSNINYTLGQYLLYFLPLSLHFGWTTAAALVNWNSMFALGAEVSSKAVAWLGHSSVVGATIIGLFVTLQRSAPVYGGVIVWALAAVASGLANRIKLTEKEDRNRVGVHGAERQRILSYSGAIANLVTSIVVSFSASSLS